MADRIEWNRKQNVQFVHNLVNTILLANVNSRSRSLYAIARPSVACLSSVTLVCPTQAVQIFRNISTAFGTLAIR